MSKRMTVTLFFQLFVCKRRSSTIGKQVTGVTRPTRQRWATTAKATTTKVSIGESRILRLANSPNLRN
jgi:hypothetical protein